MIELPIVSDPRGNLSFIESQKHIPFEIKRIYYLYDIPRGEKRAGHAHRQFQNVIIAASGSFDVHVDDGTNKQTFHLTRPNLGLYVPPMIWIELDNFSSGAVCLVVSSALFSAEDYVKSYVDFKSMIQSA